MDRTRISSEGEITLTEEIRGRLGWMVGTELEVEAQGSVVVLRPVRHFAPTTLEEVRGCVPYDGPPVSIEEMDAAVEEAAREMWEEFEQQSRNRR